MHYIKNSTRRPHFPLYYAMNTDWITAGRDAGRQYYSAFILQSLHFISFHWKEEKAWGDNWGKEFPIVSKPTYAFSFQTNKDHVSISWVSSFSQFQLNLSQVEFC